MFWHVYQISMSLESSIPIVTTRKTGIKDWIGYILQRARKSSKQEHDGGVYYHSPKFTGSSMTNHIMSPFHQIAFSWFMYIVYIQEFI